MFSYRSSSPCIVQGHLVFRSFPRLGINVDNSWNRWNVECIRGNYLNACLEDNMHPFYTSTSNDQFGFVHQTWKPYTYEVIK